LFCICIGNTAFAKGSHQVAVAHFTKALELNPSEHTYYSNRSAAYIALGKTDPSFYELAAQDGKKCVEMAPEWSKGYSRYGAALFMQKKYVNKKMIQY
jgi:tetratricopeptide (TPR) repeat protein